jgi:glycogen phosphorylase
MNEQTPVIKPNYCNLPMDVEGFDSLAELALDLRWSWNHCTDEVWRQLDPALWELTQNPWVVLQTVSKDKLKSVLADSTFQKKLMSCCKPNVWREAPAWFQKNHPQSPLKCVAYFSMEYMLSAAMQKAHFIQNGKRNETDEIKRPTRTDRVRHFWRSR